MLVKDSSSSLDQHLRQPTKVSVLSQDRLAESKCGSVLNFYSWQNSSGREQANPVAVKGPPWSKALKELSNSMAEQGQQQLHLLPCPMCVPIAMLASLQAGAQLLFRSLK